MTMKKYKCSCEPKVTWFSGETLDIETRYHIQEKGEGNHVLSEVKDWTAEDYAEVWASDLENENRHSITDMPNQILSVLEAEVWDKKIIRRIMKALYEKGIGL